MILACPSCDARYLVQIGLFASGGRPVRCARCQHQWHATLPNRIDIFIPATPAIPIAPPQAPVLEQEVSTGHHFSMPSMAEMEASVSHMAHDAMAHLPAVITHVDWHRHIMHIVLGVFFLMGFVAWPIYDRQQIVKAIPELRGFYEALGAHIPHSGKGLVFDKVRSEIKYDGGAMRLYVDGVVHNSTEEIQFIPSIKARAIGPDQRIIQSWWIAAPAPSVDAGSDVPFHAEVLTPMRRTIADVYLEFYAQDEAADVSQ